MDKVVLEVGVALILIGIASIISKISKFSTIPFLILAGMAVGPHVPKLGFIDLRFINSNDIIAFMGKLGVLFLLFYLGLEFSVSKLAKSGKAILFGGTVYVVVNFTIGLAYGFAAGFPVYESVMTAGMFAVSSTAIVAKILVDLKRTGNPETELILGMILFDDLFLAVFLSIMSGLLLSGAASVAGITGTVLVSIAYMLLFFLIARFGTPVLNRLLNISSNEIFIIVVFSAMIFVAGVSKVLHVAEAIGALLFGLMLSETEHSKRIEQLVVPFRDFFGAIFFFSFGLSIDPRTLDDAAWLAVGAAALTLLGNLLSGLLAGRKAGLTYRASTNIGLTVSARGEFTIIVANLGVTAGLMPLLKPFAALYVLILAVLAPLFAKESKRIYNGLSRVFRWENVRRQTER
ncbi:MAG: cation/H(+) antiporter [Candidatus Reconcilbacillus cellulovorans]|uniref:Cation/H(+) antiporter n=1 Tax=Candidatus Reconcilbacillus cellulovorans TaxID=1906605 RepID=A0A2A6DYJ0_9BACL|nr:MAG: cation/H(+) antiporter [Candidatus Reconcilbacillus cellulovorans]